MTRINNLDYLRGISALGIMFYHYSSWAFGHYSADDFLGRVGIYGVSIFYILSGITLYLVYFEKMKFKHSDLKLFFKKRILRIFPLLWLVNCIVLFFSDKKFAISDLILNFTGLFGFFKWHIYLSSGIWSIGNELVFYVFFPFFVFFTKSKKMLMYILSFMIFISFMYFTFFILKNDILLENQWKNYTNPLNQVFYFLLGFLIGHLIGGWNIGRNNLIYAALGALVLFIYFPIDGNIMNLITGVNRLIFTFIVTVFTISVYKLPFTFPRVPHLVLTFFGEISYSLYLLHPIVWTVVNRLFRSVFNSNTGVVIPTAILVTIVTSYLVHQYFEKLFMNLGKIRK